VGPTRDLATYEITQLENDRALRWAYTNMVKKQQEQLQDCFKMLREYLFAFGRVEYMPLEYQKKIQEERKENKILKELLNEERKKNKEKGKSKKDAIDTRYVLKLPKTNKPLEEKYYAEIKKDFTPKMLKERNQEACREYGLNEETLVETGLLSDNERIELMEKDFSKHPEQHKEFRKYVFQVWTQMRAVLRYRMTDPEILKFVRDLEIEFEGKPDYNHPYTPEEFHEIFKDMGGTLSEDERRKLFPEEYEMMDFIKKMEDSAQRLENYEKMKEAKLKAEKEQATAKKKVNKKKLLRKPKKYPSLLN